jgi:Fe-S-cluster containining protein
VTAEVEAWTKVPPMQCKGLCADSCGPIEASPLERRLLAAHGVRLPSVEDALMEMLAGGDGKCPALREGRCSVYDVRPTICRLWGVVEGMPCPHGCVPEGGRLPDMLGQAILANSFGS